jgi:hypothetical protein
VNQRKGRLSGSLKCLLNLKMRRQAVDFGMPEGWKKDKWVGQRKCKSFFKGQKFFEKEELDLECLCKIDAAEVITLVAIITVVITVGKRKLFGKLY